MAPVNHRKPWQRSGIAKPSARLSGDLPEAFVDLRFVTSHQHDCTYAFAETDQLALLSGQAL